MNKEINDLFEQVLNHQPSLEVKLLAQCAQVLNGIEDDDERKYAMLGWGKYMLESFGHSVTKIENSEG